MNKSNKSWIEKLNMAMKTVKERNRGGDTIIYGTAGNDKFSKNLNLEEMFTNPEGYKYVAGMDAYDTSKDAGRTYVFDRRVLNSRIEEIYHIDKIRPIDLFPDDFAEYLEKRKNSLSEDESRWLHFYNRRKDFIMKYPKTPDEII